MANLLSKPRISGNTRVSSLYQIMNSGLTKTVLLLGHADAENFQPYQVFNMQETLNLLGADLASPLVRALLECYNTGGRDIWVYPVAPMSEYVTLPSGRYVDISGQTFYERYYERLTTAYQLLKEYDFYHYIVPVEAPFYDSGDIDFLTQLADFCSESFNETGSVAMGVLGTRVPNQSAALESSTNYNSTTIQEMIDDTRIAALGDKGKFVTVMVGEGSYMHSQTSGIYSRPFDVSVATMMATTPLERSLPGLKIRSVAGLSHGLFSETQIEALAQAKLNTVYKTARGRRGAPFEVKLLTDNTAGQNGSDYWSASQMRTISTIANRIREFGYALIGGPNADVFKSAVKAYLDELRREQKIINYSLKITLEQNSRAIVELGIMPVFGLKNILFTVAVGPGE